MCQLVFSSIKFYLNTFLCLLVAGYLEMKLKDKLPLPSASTEET